MRIVFLVALVRDDYPVLPCQNIKGGKGATYTDRPLPAHEPHLLPPNLLLPNLLTYYSLHPNCLLLNSYLLPPTFLRLTS